MNKKDPKIVEAELEDLYEEDDGNELDIQAVLTELLMRVSCIEKLCLKKNVFSKEEFGKEVEIAIKQFNKTLNEEIEKRQKTDFSDLVTKNNKGLKN